jgi:hypothetical protein
MATVTITDRTMNVEIEGLDKLWSFRSRLLIPLEHIRGATTDPGIVGESSGWKEMGTRVPGVITAGTFHQDGGHVFWDVHDPAKAVVIELNDEQYQRLVIQVDDPGATAAAIQEAIRTGPA